jgi:hypothetical protein
MIFRVVISIIVMSSIISTAGIIGLLPWAITNQGSEMNELGATDSQQSDRKEPAV